MEYIFQTNTGSVRIEASSRERAMEKFQERYGYWPTELGEE